MQHALFTHAPAGERDREELRAVRADQPSAVAAGPTQGPWSVVLGLQRSAGNAAVTRMLEGRGSSTATVMPFGGRRRSPVVPISVSRQADDDEWGESSSEWSSGGESESGGGSEWSSGETGGGYGGDSAEPEQSPGAEWSGGDAGGSEPETSPGAEWSGAESGGGSGGGESEASPGAEWSGGGSGGGPGSEWSGGGSGGGEEQTGDDSGSWWPFGGGDEESEGDSGPSWWPFGGDEESEEDEGEHSDEDIDGKMAEGESGTESDVYVPTGGGPPPHAATTSGSGGFHDGGRQATVPFGVPIDMSDPDEALHPHAFTGGGRAGTIPWSGGGKFGGPKGNQGTGAIAVPEVVPEYDSSWGGLFSNADAWVRSGTGVADVYRDYSTTDPGDQGNGWWVSARAASALDAHEQRHVTASKSVYDSTIQPALDRIAKSGPVGKGKAYLQSTARELLRRFVGWEGALKRFKEDDAAYNADQGQIDIQDVGSPGYPVPMHGPRTIQGKEYESYLIMGSEPDPT
jgi:hypothetical protein